MLADDAGAQLTSSSAQTETTSSRTVEKEAPPEAEVDKDERAGEVASTLTPQEDEASSRATNIAVVDPEAE